METESTSSRLCRICRSAFTNKYHFREMMFGFRDDFVYHECSGCGCLEIDEIPADIERFYPSYYYSFTTKISGLKKPSGLNKVIPSFFIKKQERKARKKALSYLKPMQITRWAKILDVGCGKGELICRLFDMGFQFVEGTDLYLPKEINYGFGVRVRNNPLREIESNTYDLVMMHHVLEHMYYPEDELKECFRILKNKSYLMIRIPVKNFAWEKYKENWVQLDAPRHFIIHTVKSVSLLAEKTGFKLNDVVYDSESFQFEGSEFYIRNIPLCDPLTHNFRPAKAVLPKEKIKFFKTEAKKLNETQRGDQAIFYLYKD